MTIKYGSLADPVYFKERVRRLIYEGLNLKATHQQLRREGFKVSYRRVRLMSAEIHHEKQPENSTLRSLVTDLVARLSALASDPTLKLRPKQLIELGQGVVNLSKLIREAKADGEDLMAPERMTDLQLLHTLLEGLSADQHGKVFALVKRFQRENEDIDHDAEEQRKLHAILAEKETKETEHADGESNDQDRDSHRPGVCTREAGSGADRANDPERTEL